MTDAAADAENQLEVRAHIYDSVSCCDCSYGCGPYAAAYGAVAEYGVAGGVLPAAGVWADAGVGGGITAPLCTYTLHGAVTMTSGLETNFHMNTKTASVLAAHSEIKRGYCVEIHICVYITCDQQP
jgi:hypothetical protein